MATRVHLADDHTMFRQGLRAILASQERIEVVGTSSTGPEAAEQVRRTRPDVIVTQLDMQPKSAQEIIEGLREASPGSRIVVLTMWDNLRYLQAISKIGALQERGGEDRAGGAVDRHPRDHLRRRGRLPGRPGALGPRRGLFTERLRRVVLRTSP